MYLKVGDIVKIDANAWLPAGLPRSKDWRTRLEGRVVQLGFRCNRLLPNGRCTNSTDWIQVEVHIFIGKGKRKRDEGLRNIYFRRGELSLVNHGHRETKPSRDERGDK